MSLHAFGKVRTVRPAEVRATLSSLASRCGARFIFDDLDDGDRVTLYDIPELTRAQPGVDFVLYDAEGSAEATGLWNDATRQMREKLLIEPGAQYQVEMTPEITRTFLETNLGRLCAGILSLESASVCGLALIDGSVDRVVRASADDCLSAIASEVPWSWDLVSGTLYVVPVRAR